MLEGNRFLIFFFLVKYKTANFVKFHGIIVDSHTSLNQKLKKILQKIMSFSENFYKKIPIFF